jgi:hypothetical protein
VLAEAAGNPGTAVINAMNTAVAAARRVFDVPEDSPVFFWELDGADDHGVLRAVPAGDDDATLDAFDWKSDAQLAGAIDALRDASRPADRG